MHISRGIDTISYLKAGTFLLVKMQNFYILSNFRWCKRAHNVMRLEPVFCPNWPSEMLKNTEGSFCWKILKKLTAEPVSFRDIRCFHCSNNLCLCSDNDPCWHSRKMKIISSDWIALFPRKFKGGICWGQPSCRHIWRRVIAPPDVFVAEPAK